MSLCMLAFPAVLIAAAAAGTALACSCIGYPDAEGCGRQLGRSNAALCNLFLPELV